MKGCAMDWKQIGDLVSKCADEILNEELRYEAERVANGFRPRETTQEMIDNFRKEKRAYFWSIAFMVEDRNICYHSHRRGLYHPSNPLCRRIFCAVTGLTLPGTVSGTNQVVCEYVGQQVIDKYEQNLLQEKEAEENARVAKRRQEFEAWVAKVTADVIADEMISGDDLATLCRHLNIELHPRTIGTLRNRVHLIKSDTGRCTGRGHLPTTVFAAYRSCRKSLTTQGEPVPA